MNERFQEPSVELPPNCLEEERGALGCILLDAVQGMETCASSLRGGAAAFYEERHREIYHAVANLIDAGEPVDVVTVARKLKDHGKLDDVGGIAYLSALPDETPSASNLPYYLETVSNAYLRRSADAAFVKLAIRARDRTEGIGEVLADADKAIAALREDGKTCSGSKTMLELSKAAVDRWEDAASGKPKTGIPFNIPGLGNIFKWAECGRLIVVGARPSVGKSSVLLHVAHEAAVTGIPVGFISQEMLDGEVYDRLASRETGIPYSRIGGKDTSERERPQLVGALAKLKTLPIHVLGEKLTISQIAAQTSQWIRKNDIKALFVDYLGITIKTRASASLYEHVTEVSQALKGLALKYRIPVITAAQFGREVEKEERPPRLSDFRDSGSVEQDADVAILLSEDPANPNELTFIVAKNRAGPQGKAQVRFDRPTCRFGLAGID